MLGSLEDGLADVDRYACRGFFMYLFLNGHIAGVACTQTEAKPDGVSSGSNVACVRPHHLTCDGYVDAEFRVVTLQPPYLRVDLLA